MNELHEPLALGPTEAREPLRSAGGSGSRCIWGGSIIYALAFCAFNGKWEICWRSTCLKIEKRCERGIVTEGVMGMASRWLQCMSYVVKRRFRLIEKRQKQKQNK